MSLNKIQIIGNLKADAEVRAVGATNMAIFTVATSEKWKDKNGQLQSATEWHDCELWGQDNVHRCLTKGQLVYVEGSIRTESWESNGQKHSRKKIKVLTVQLLSTGNPRAQQQGSAAPQQAPPMQQQPQYQQQGGYYPPQQQGYYPQQSRNSSFPQNQRVDEDDMAF